jgi:hypothetical protein
MRVLFPDNTGSAVSVTNNYALLINNQTANTGTVTYTNRWGVYQEGSSDLNYFAANVLIGSSTNSGQALQVTGTGIISSSLTAASFIPSGSTVPTNGLYLPTTNTIAFATNGSERIRISSSGNVGLGTSSVTDFGSSYTVLDVFNSSVGGYILARNPNVTGQISVDSIGMSVQTRTNHHIDFTPNNNPCMRIFTTGNVLISTGGGSDAGFKLDVNGTGRFSSSITTGAPSGGTAAAWKFGSRVAAAVALSTTQYIELDVGGTLYKLAIVT